MSEQKQYRFLEPRPRSNYRQLFIKGRRIRAEILYRETVGVDLRTPEQVADDFNVPLEAVREAIDYCANNPELLRQERVRDLGTEQSPYRLLEPRTGSRYRQLFVRGRRIRAEDLYRQTVGEGPRTPEQVAEDYEVPLEAVLESIDYCIHNEALLRREREEDLEAERALGLDKPPPVPPDYQPES